MRYFLRIFGFLLCVLPPAVSAAAFLPIWLTDRATVLPALALLLCALTLPLLLYIFRAHLRPPSVWMVWLGLWGFLFVFSPILPAIETIALISFPTALFGALCTSLGQKGKPAPKEE